MVDINSKNIVFKETLSLEETIIKTINERLERFKGNKSMAAKSLKISRTTLRLYADIRWSSRH